MRLTLELAKKICLELWTFCAETGEGKEDWPGWETYAHYGYFPALCPFCRYDEEMNAEEYMGACEYCPIEAEFGDCSETYYQAWLEAKQKRTRKKYARLFLEQLKELLEEAK